MKNILIISLLSISIMACSNNAPVETNNSDSTIQTNQVQQLAQSDLDTMIQKDSVILIDVRTPGEISQGYIEGADSFINFNSNDFATKINQLDKNYTYVMYCRSGGRSGKASEYMIKNGFSNVYNLQGGILQYKGALVQP